MCLLTKRKYILQLENCPARYIGLLWFTKHWLLQALPKPWVLLHTRSYWNASLTYPHFEKVLNGGHPITSNLRYEIKAVHLWPQSNTPLRHQTLCGQHESGPGPARHLVDLAPDIFSCHQGEAGHLCDWGIARSVVMLTIGAAATAGADEF